jgi:protein ImuA
MTSSNTQILQDVLRHPAIWRARQLAQEQQQRPDKVVATDFSTLDQALPDGGWPAGALTELLVDATGIGELSLLLPALRNVCAQGRGVALLAPPWLPYARTWESLGIPLDKLLLIETSSSDLLWSAEQILRSGECGAVVLWGQAAGRALDHRALQRLHLAAGTGNALCFVYRAFSAEANPSPAPLRLKLQPHEGGLRVHFLKYRGVFQAKTLPLATFPDHWQNGGARIASNLSTLPAPPCRLPQRRLRSS